MNSAAADADAVGQFVCLQIYVVVVNKLHWSVGPANAATA